MVLLLMHQLLNALGPCSLILTEDLLFPPLLMNSNLNSLSSSFSFTRVCPYHFGHPSSFQKKIHKISI